MSRSTDSFKGFPILDHVFNPRETSGTPPFSGPQSTTLNWSPQGRVMAKPLIKDLSIPAPGSCVTQSPRARAWSWKGYCITW